MPDACVLDTHTWVFSTTQPGDIPPRARRLLKRCDTHLVPAYSLYELSLLIARGRLAIAEADRDPARWMREALADPCELAPLTPEIAARAVELLREGFHRDPADALIYATADTLGLPLVTGDRKIHAFEAHLPKKSMRLAVWE